MGGRERLEAVKSLRLEGAQHTLLAEQSYRQEPFITAYARTREEIELLLAASNAPDLHFEAPQRVRGTLHPVLAFNWQGRAVHLLINPFNHLPDAVESVAVFYDHWWQWGRCCASI